jgi:hypothetical protein
VCTPGRSATAVTRYAVPLDLEVVSNIPSYVPVPALQLCVYAHCTKFSTQVKVQSTEAGAVSSCTKI